MTVTLNRYEILHRANGFMRDFADAHYEMGEAQNFIRGLCDVFGFSNKRMVSFEQRIKMQLNQINYALRCVGQTSQTLKSGLLLTVPPRFESRPVFITRLISSATSIGVSPTGPTPCETRRSAATAWT